MDNTTFSMYGFAFEQGLGALVLCASLLIHGLGMATVHRWHERFAARNPRVPIARRAIFSVLILLMLATHSSEIALWGIVLALARAVPNIQDGIYYVSVTYTTLGYGEDMLARNWRSIAPMIAMSGLFAFGWTTGVLFRLVNEKRPAGGGAGEGS